MIKTLRITAVIAVVLAVGFLVFPAVFGARSDEQIEQFLSSQGVIEQFRKANKQKGTKSKSQSSPLVKQAEAFALYLNPPAEKIEKSPSVRRSQTGTYTPPPVSAKFELIGTCYYTSKPELSLALIDEPGKGFRWVRQSSKVGYTVIEQIKDGSVIIRDSKGTRELVAEREQQRSLIKAKVSASAPESSMDMSSALTIARPGIKSSVKGIRRKSGGLSAASRRSRAAHLLAGRGTRTKDSESTQADEKEDIAVMEELINSLKALQDAESDKSDLQDALMEKFISDLSSMRIGDEEAKKLGNLGRKLKDANQGQSRAENESGQSDANSTEPNSPDDEN